MLQHNLKSTSQLALPCLGALYVFRSSRLFFPLPPAAPGRPSIDLRAPIILLVPLRHSRKEAASSVGRSVLSPPAQLPIASPLLPLLLAEMPRGGCVAQLWFLPACLPAWRLDSSSFNGKEVGRASCRWEEKRELNPPPHSRPAPTWTDLIFQRLLRGFSLSWPRAPLRCMRKKVSSPSDDRF